MSKNGFKTKELTAQRDGQNIYGVAYVPKDAADKLPTVVISHGFGGSYQQGIEYAEALAENGYAAYCFDFCGGGFGSRSDGAMTEMSIFTEKQDLEAVITMLKEQEFVDETALFLFGASQGGAVSAITAGAHPEQIKGLILMFPAFVLVDDAKKMFARVEDIPDTYQIMGVTIGRTYAERLLDYDIYQAIVPYTKDVLILHGDADTIVPLRYAERAVEVYASSKLEVMPGEGHGFGPEATKKSIELMLEYLDAHC